MEFEVTGALMQSYTICKRQVWLMAHQIVPDQEHPYIEIGRLIDENSYQRDRKKIHFENVVLDLVRMEKDNILIGEVKKSSKAAESAKMQLLFYLYKLKQSGITAKGQLFFPEERKREVVELTPEFEIEVIKAIEEIKGIVHKEKPPAFIKIPYCKNCGYKEFCLS
ncbi:CRISPR-associated protein Cas4 [Thermoanaerobacter uzonensis]|nr:CRISPR-associated protein Cas4 [Thermoanaerobacter uzonensis]